MKSKKFNTQEVQAIIAGNKTMFREVVKPEPNSNINPVYLKEIEAWQWATKESQRTPKFRVGQEIFVKGQEPPITLKIKSVEVERLQDISEEDAVKEGGVFKSDNYWHSTLHPTKGTYQCWTSAKEAFSKLWNSTHKKQEHKWEANPWVFAYEFEVINFKK